MLFPFTHALGSAKPMNYSSYQEQRVTSTTVFSVQCVFIGCKTVTEKVIEIPYMTEEKESADFIAFIQLLTSQPRV